MITYKTGDLFDEDVEAIVNTVNTVGVMGRGVALQFKKRYPENFKAYAAACKRDEVRPGVLRGYADGGDAPDKRLELLPDALKAAEACLGENADTRAHLAKVSDLVTGFESPFGLELLSTVHWVVTRKRPPSPADVVHEVYAWGPRKRQFSERQIALSVTTLTQKGWIPGFEGSVTT